jgi:hypothetical protein
VSSLRAALLLGGIPVVIGLIYLVLWAINGGEAVVDPAGVILLVALGLSMGFGMIVVLRGARDL